MGKSDSRQLSLFAQGRETEGGHPSARVVSIHLAREKGELKRRAEIDKQILARAAHLLDREDEE